MRWGKQLTMSVLCGFCAYGGTLCAAAEAEVVLASRPDWIRLRAKALELAAAHMEKLDGWRPQMTCMPGVPYIWQWDSCFMALFAGYAPAGVDGLGNLDNLYAMQAEDGFIAMTYSYETRKPVYATRVNPPLYAWCEWEYARRTGDRSRLTKAYESCGRLYGWLKKNRRRPDGLYWFEDAGSSGMDNSPRSGWLSAHLDGSDVSFVDLCCQQVLAARCLAKMAPLVGKPQEAGDWEKEAEALSKLVNRKMWSEKTGFYHDVFNSGNKLANKTVAGYWALVSGVAGPRQAAALAAHLENPQTFGARNSVPSLSRDDPNYRADGGYWRGSVWPPALYMTVAGLRRQGYRALARKLAARHLDNMSEVFTNRVPATIWECYSPDLPAPAMKQEGVVVRGDFVGWGGLGPIVMLVEDVLGLDIDAISGEITWHLSETGAQGFHDFTFDGGRVSLDAEVLNDAAFTVSVATERPFLLTVVSPNGEVVLEKRVEVGKSDYKSSHMIGRKVTK